jgi:Mn-dependent DtxR family transcriptional regulator
LRKTLSPSSEDYLEAIYDLSKERIPVRSIDVSNRLNVSRASVNKAVGLLMDSGLLSKQPYGTITLTDKGESIAARVRQCHTTIRTFLQEFLNVPGDVAEEEACKIEHAISDDTLDRFIEFIRKNTVKDSPSREQTDTGFNIVEITDEGLKSEICELVLRDLKDWFEVESAVDIFVRSVREMPFFCAYDGSKPVGFAALKFHHRCTAEVYVMGVLTDYRRKGIGRLIVSRCVDYCKEKGLSFLTVKTLDGSHPDKGYAETRAFYLAMGFKPLETFSTVWNEENPCLFLALHID